MGDLSDFYRLVLGRRLARYAFGGEADDESPKKPAPTVDEMVRSVRPPAESDGGKIDYSASSPQAHDDLEGVKKAAGALKSFPVGVRFKRGGVHVTYGGKF